MSYISNGVITLTSSEFELVDNLTALATSGIGEFLRKTGTTTFANATPAEVGLGTVTSVAALTLGTTGTDLSSTVATGTTTPVITLNVPTASASNRGALSSTDWSTFNNKQPAGSYLTSLSGAVLTTDIGTSVLAYRTFGTAANNNTGDFEVPLTFSTGLNRIGNTITSTITQYTDALAVSAVGTPWTGLGYLTSLSGAVLTSQASPQTIGATGSRLAMLWATDITLTNKLTGNITGNADGNAGTVTNGIYTTSDATALAATAVGDKDKYLHANSSTGVLEWSTPSFTLGDNTVSAGKLQGASATKLANGSSGNLLKSLGDGTFGWDTTAYVSGTPWTAVGYYIGDGSAFATAAQGALAASALQSVTAHNLLSATHGDTLADTVVRGDIMYGNATPKWARLAFPATPTGKVLIASATDITWSTSALGTAAYTATTAYEVPLTFGDGLTRTVNDVDLDTTLTGMVSITSTTFVGALTGTASGNLTSANIVATITNGVTDKAPSEDAVFDALALKAPLSDTNTPPTDLKISTASKGGVFNGGFELGTKDTAVTASGIIGVNSGWYLSEDAGQMSAELDTAVCASGISSLKLEAIDTSGGGVVYNTSGVTLPILSLEAIPLKVSTLYRLTLKAKTNLVGASGVFGGVIQYDSAAVVGTTIATSKLSTTTDWTILTITFTSDNDAVFGRLALYNNVAGTVNQAWFDDIKLEEVVTETTFTGKVAEKIRPVLQAVTSTNNIDQSNLVENADGAVGDSGGIEYVYAQRFTPTKKYLTGVTIKKGTTVGTPTGNLVFQIVTDSTGPTTTFLASKFYTLEQWNAISDGETFVDLPCILTIGVNYWVKILDSSAEATNTCYLMRINTSGGTGLLWTSANGGAFGTAANCDLYFKSNYTKKTESFSLIANGIKTELKSDKDGLLSGSIIDLDNGKYRFDSGAFGVGGATVLANSFAFSNDVFSSTAGGRQIAPVFSIINDWYVRIGGSNFIQSKNDAVDRYIILKVNTLLPIKHLKLDSYLSCYGVGPSTLEVSADNVNYTTILTVTTSQSTVSVSNKAETDLMNGLSIFYLKIHKSSAVSDYLQIGQQIIEADLDTSSIPQGLLYPLSTNQFTETIKLPSVATRAYFRLAKYQNEYGVVVPAIEFTDASAVSIGYAPLKLDNSQETNPAVAIVVASTTNAQNSGTGTLEGANYILNDGEYMTLSTAVDELSLVYLVGKGTTAFTNITKNTLYLSSNGDSNDATQDPSHQGNFIIGARQQGLLDRVKDIGDEIEATRKGFAETKQYIRNNAFTARFDTGTTDDYAITMTDFQGYVTGMSVMFRANTANTTGATLNINGMGAKAIVKGISTSLATNDILALMWCQLVYDGVSFVLLNPRVL